MGSTIAVNIGQLGGNTDTFMPIFFADTLSFAVANICKNRTGNSVCRKCTKSYHSSK